jgi:Fe2+ or Zn2+ uptake regulation protein
VIEVDSDAFRKTVEAAGEVHDFEIASAQVELTGYCAACRRSGQAAVEPLRGV